VVIDGNTRVDTLMFYYTSKDWKTWAFSSVDVNLPSGDHKIRLEAVRSGGIANIDYFMVIGVGPVAAMCTPQYVINVTSDSSAWGSVWFTPTKTYYDKGTQVTMHANAHPGYFFQCWTGEETSADSVFTFTVKSNVNAVARFLPNNLQRDTTIVGYASVEDDKGTPYWIFGGALGDTVEALTINDLKTYLGDADPHVVKFSGAFVGPDTLMVKSNKTLLGIDNTAHLRNIEVRLNQVRNVIIRNIAVSHVHPKDAIGINDKSKNIFIDHCEFYSQRGDNDGDGVSGTEADKDWFDGLLDIKNESSFITVAWSIFHDHYKVCLMASNDEASADSVARITFHHNYFYNCESRLPLIRFGKAHIFNNYYKDCHNAINSRMGAWVRVENNYFDGVYRSVFDDLSLIGGNAQLIDNHFGTSIVESLPVCDLQIPYTYTLDPTDSIPKIIANGIRTDVEAPSEMMPKVFQVNQNYPNPFNPMTTIQYDIPDGGTQRVVSLRVYDLLGREVAVLVNGQKTAGPYQVTWDASAFPSGVYFYRLQAGDCVQSKKLILLK
jgi:pectate lyase